MGVVASAFPCPIVSALSGTVVSVPCSLVVGSFCCKGSVTSVVVVSDFPPTSFSF